MWASSPTISVRRNPPYPTKKGRNEKQLHSAPADHICENQRAYDFVLSSSNLRKLKISTSWLPQTVIYKIPSDRGDFFVV